MPMYLYVIMYIYIYIYIYIYGETERERSTPLQTYKIHPIPTERRWLLDSSAESFGLSDWSGWSGPSSSASGAASLDGRASATAAAPLGGRLASARACLCSFLSKIVSPIEACSGCADPPAEPFLLSRSGTQAGIDSCMPPVHACACV